MNKPSPCGLSNAVQAATRQFLVSLCLAAATPLLGQETQSNSAVSPSAPSPETIRWLALTNGEMGVCGLPWFKENGGQLSRLPVRSKADFRPAVWSLAQSPTGARVRFRSDTRVLSIRLEYPSAPNMANMHAFGQTGVDLYSDGTYLTTVVADAEARHGKVYEKVLFDFSKQPRVERELTLYLPPYKPVKVLGVGVDPGARVAPARPFALPKPVVFYGTSITQGGCASRPGLNYEAMLGRQLNIDFVNLGFSGNGLGEPEVARAVAEIDAACFVLDFGANHKTSAELEKVYAPFLDTLRAKHLKTPILAVTPLRSTGELRDPAIKRERQQQREHIRQLVRQRVSEGDTKLSLVEGADLLGPNWGDGLVDGSHPNDLGFRWMADGLAAPLRQALGLR